ncbi:interphotoreceptor matrix proteoglycan 2-like [Lingula anatina]|uniref:Interphotoreceptor matrix proteoglycan 2-like n=1 Tax=Lingula anatina TaxID=7574 RepID=A0A1S3IUX4_LINAN|nr:interphotoreceptor matrix proteoglycan 2-like [Lingula anatina]|eukprot:XP_013402002.1 interphotoreceptor matrix proteoglycan 2-like [Lingula anatina]
MVLEPVDVAKNGNFTINSTAIANEIAEAPKSNAMDFNLTVGNKNFKIEKSTLQDSLQQGTEQAKIADQIQEETKGGLCSKIICDLGFVCDENEKDFEKLCKSKCEMEPGFCQNDGICEHFSGHDVKCKCVAKPPYTFHGDRCQEQYLSVLYNEQTLIIVLSAVGGAVVLVVLVIVIACVVRRKRRSANSKSSRTARRSMFDAGSTDYPGFQNNYSSFTNYLDDDFEYSYGQVNKSKGKSKRASEMLEMDETRAVSTDRLHRPKSNNYENLEEPDYSPPLPIKSFDPSDLEDSDESAAYYDSRFKGSTENLPPPSLEDPPGSSFEKTFLNWNPNYENVDTSQKITIQRPSYDPVPLETRLTTFQDGITHL